MPVVIKNTFLVFSNTDAWTSGRRSRSLGAAESQADWHFDESIAVAATRQLQRLSRRLEHCEAESERHGKGPCLSDSTTESPDSADDCATDASDPWPSSDALRRSSWSTEAPPCESRPGIARQPQPLPTLTRVRTKADANRESLAKAQERTRFAHALVPRKVDLSKEHCEADRVTTVMVRNIPSNYSQRDLLEDLSELGLGGTLDFLYIPLDKGTMTNVGYAFVNFVEPCVATRCVAALQGFRFRRNRRDKGRMAAVSPAHIQGLDANLRHYERTVVMTAKQKQRRPLVLANLGSK